MKEPKYPSLLQMNTRVWLTELSQNLGRRATLDDIPDEALNRMADNGFDWVWFLSVWLTGEASKKISRENANWRREFEDTLPDLREEDIAGSGFAITGYTVHPDMGGDDALRRLRGRLRQRGLKLMLDFVPNHMAPDHPWVDEHPDYFVQGTPEDLIRSPQNYTLVKGKQSDMIIAYGRDPYFSGWADTVQLDYSNPATVKAMGNELLRISTQCDGVRCDMAMLVLPDVFEKTWGRKAEIFWPVITQRIHETFPDFLFMAEVYWDMEWTLQQQGFDYTYDKRLYDRLLEGNTRSVRDHLRATPDYQDKLARFLENHDEPRAATAFENNNHKAAALITFFSQGLRFFHQGQFEGRKIRISPHLVRAPQEPVDAELQTFYQTLLQVMRNPLYRGGRWNLLESNPAWEGNGTGESFIAFAWEGDHEEKSLVVVNYAPHASQCYIRLPFSGLIGQAVSFRDMMGPSRYDRDGNEVLSRGIYLDLPAWGYHVFDVHVKA